MVKCSYLGNLGKRWTGILFCNFSEGLKLCQDKKLKETRVEQGRASWDAY